MTFPMPWCFLQATKYSRIDLPMTLCGGQCFRWHPTAQGRFVGVVGPFALELRESAALQTKRARNAMGSDPRIPAGGHGGGGAVDYRILGVSPSSKVTHGGACAAVFHYLSLDVPLPALWRQWTSENPMKSHPLVAYLLTADDVDTPSRSRTAQGEEEEEAPYANIRHLRQNIHETLFSFVCSQNNHVKRITAMVKGLCARYGTLICVSDVAGGGGGDGDTQAPAGAVSKAPARRKRGRSSSPDGGSPPKRATSNADSSDGSRKLYAFPTVQQLRKADEVTLREMGFGYRSKFIVGCVEAIANYKSRTGSVEGDPNSTDLPPEHHDSCLDSPFYRDLVRCPSREEQRRLLLSLPGVGRKVADCVLLFALGHSALVPVDTHMAQVAAAYLSPASSPAAGRRSKGAKPAAAPATDWQDVLREWKQKGRAKALKKKTNDTAAEDEILPVLTEKHHTAIQQGFEQLFGPHAGWAHSILFYKRMRR